MDSADVRSVMDMLLNATEVACESELNGLRDMQFTDDMEKQATELRRSNAAHERELKAQCAAVHASLKEVVESSAASMTMSSLVNAVVEEGTTRELRNEQLAAEERLKKAVAALGAELRERLEANEARLQADHAKREQLLQDAEVRPRTNEQSLESPFLPHASRALEKITSSRLPASTLQKSLPDTRGRRRNSTTTCGRRRVNGGR